MGNQDEIRRLLIVIITKLEWFARRTNSYHEQCPIQACPCSEFQEKSASAGSTQGQEAPIPKTQDSSTATNPKPEYRVRCVHFCVSKEVPQHSM